MPSWQPEAVAGFSVGPASSAGRMNARRAISPSPLTCRRQKRVDGRTDMNDCPRPARPTGSVVLSPHPDDAALSLAGLAHVGVLPPPITVVTVFDQTDFAGFSPLRGAESVSKMRAAEDDTFASQLGASLIRLGHADACLRYPDRTLADLFAPAPLERDLFNALAGTLDALRVRFAGALLVGPAGEGGHIDHLLVNSVVRRSTWTLRLLYADQPYALEGAARPANAVHVLLAEAAAVRSKLRAAEAYRSQPAAARLKELLRARDADDPVEWVSSCLP
jgi:LmbE family N-acetylglucosaminyl deacetylase